MTQVDRLSRLREIVEIRQIQTEQARWTAASARQHAAEAERFYAAKAGEIEHRAEKWANARETGPNPALHDSWRHAFRTLLEEHAALAETNRVAAARYDDARRSWYAAEMAKEAVESLVRDAGRLKHRRRDEARLADNEDRIASRWRSE